MAFAFLPNTIGTPAGQKYYQTKWDPNKRMIRSDNPNLPGLTSAGTMKAQTPVYATPATAVPSPQSAPNPNAGNVSYPAMFSGNQQQPQTQPVVAYPTYPATVPDSGGISKVTVPRSENVAGQTNQLFGDLENLKGTVSNALSQFYAQFPEWQQNQQQTGAMENQATRRVYSGEEQAALNSLLADYETKAQGAVQKSIDDTQRLRSRSLIAQGAGPSSAIDRAQFSTIANINANAAAQAADRGLAANQWLTNLQQQAAGTQASRDRLALGDTLLPAQAGTSAFQNILGLLQGLSGVEQPNLMTGLVAPGGYVGDSYSGLQAARLQDLGRLNQLDQNVINNQLATVKSQQDAFKNQLDATALGTNTRWGDAERAQTQDQIQNQPDNDWFDLLLNALTPKNTQG